MTWRISASFYEASFGSSDVGIEKELRDQFDRCTWSPSGDHDRAGVDAASRVLVDMAIALARSVRGRMPGAGAAVNGGRHWLVAAQGHGGLIDELSIMTVAEPARDD